MTAAMSSLANTHGITLSFMKSLGGKEALLREFPTIKQQVSGTLLTVENVECLQKYFSEFAGVRRDEKYFQQDCHRLPHLPGHCPP